jgi:hypothetical protein
MQAKSVKAAIEGKRMLQFLESLSPLSVLWPVSSSLPSRLNTARKPVKPDFYVFAEQLDVGVFR